MHRALVAAPLFVCLLPFSSLAGTETRPWLGAGEFPRLQVPRGEARYDLPLRRTDVRATVAGHLARVEVAQTWDNPFTEPIETVYVFPLPPNSAVDDFRMVVGGRVIQGEVKKREDARRTYEEAWRRGNTAALLEQERPNVFTQTIANVAPGEELQVVTRYVQDLAYDEGRYEFSFPMVVGPRFFPNPLALPGCESVQESRVSPPVLPGAQRTGNDVSLEVSVDSGFPVREVECPTHEITTRTLGDRSFQARLAPHETIANRDLVLRWRVDGKESQAAVLTHRGQRGGYFTLMVQPPELDVRSLVGDREILFVVDSSGSMSGLPIWLCKEAMRDALRRLRPLDTFNLITFSGSTAQAFARPRQATGENVAQALAWLEEIRAGGGTMMMDALAAALKPEVEAGRRRHVFFLTDGLVGNDQEIIGAARAYVAGLEKRGQRGRVFSFGVGSSPNRYLLDGIAAAGKGVAVYASNREDPIKGVVRFFRLIDHPVMEDVAIDWGSLPVSHLHPSSTPDLFLSKPLVVHGRYEAAARGTITVRGYADGKKVEIPVRVELSGEDHGDPAIATLWARSQVEDLLADLAYRRMSGLETADARIREEVTGLGISWHLVTPYTSFVAVDNSRVVGDGNPATVEQPVEVPEDVDATMAGSRVKKLGLLQMLGSRSGSDLGHLIDGTVGSSSGLSTAGSAGGPAVRGFGFGIESSGAGGGGLGSLDTKGRGGLASGDVGMHAPSVSFAAATVTGSLDKDVIAQVIRRYAGQLRYAYEVALMSNPALSGRVVLRMTIGKDGKVTEAKVESSGVGDRKFEQALLAIVRRWLFPAPPGGGSVVVTYPFVFRR